MVLSHVYEQPCIMPTESLLEGVLTLKGSKTMSSKASVLASPAFRMSGVVRSLYREEVLGVLAEVLHHHSERV